MELKLTRNQEYDKSTENVEEVVVSTKNAPDIIFRQSKDPKTLLNAMTKTPKLIHQRHTNQTIMEDQLKCNFSRRRPYLKDTASMGCNLGQRG